MVSEEFRTSLVNEVKKYPQIWNSGKGVKTDAIWSDIGKKFDVPLRRLRILWSSIHRQYFYILLARTIERNNRACTWVLFHHMSFMYEKTKKLVEERLGGISPPLLKRCKSTPNLRCPCCVPTPTDDKSGASSSKKSTVSDSDDPLIVSDTETIDTRELKNCTAPNNLETLNEASQPVKTRRTSFYTKSRDRHSVEREQIIDAIKTYPVLYAKDSPGPKCSLSFAWKMVAKKVGLPLITIQNRWRLFKRRYVEELMRQRHTDDEPFNSKWENFDQMEFMRDHMKSDIENIDRIRQEIHQIVQDQKSRKPIDLCRDEDDADQRVDELQPNKPRSLSDQVQLSKDHSTESAILTLDLISDTEADDYINDEDFLSLSDDNESFRTESPADVYHGKVAEYDADDIICIDDDDENMA